MVVSRWQSCRRTKDAGQFPVGKSALAIGTLREIYVAITANGCILQLLQFVRQPHLDPAPALLGHLP